MGAECKECCSNYFFNNQKINKELFEREFEIKVVIDKKIDENEFNQKIPDKIFKYITKNTFKIPNDKQINTNVLKMPPIKYLTGDIYQGTWNQNYLKDGLGKYYKESDQKFIEGIWENNILIYGRIFFSNYDIYQGDIKELDKEFYLNGRGKMLYHKSGDQYNGDFINGKREGDGTYIFSDETKYKGKFVNNKFRGYGEMKWPHLQIKYIGEFSDGLFNNHGKLIGNNGEQYEGNFKNGLYDGRGKYTFDDGSTYEGSFSANFRHGDGIFINKNNEFRFEGRWENDFPHGKGTFIIGDITIKGDWRNGYIETIEGQINNDFNEDILNFQIPNINLIPDRLPHMNPLKR